MPDSFDYTTGTNSENVRLLQALIDDAPEYTEETNSRNANILKSIINNTEYTDAPQSEIEELLLRLKAKIGGEIEVDELTVTENGTYDAGVNKAYNPVNVELPLSSKTITENGTYTASSDNLAGFNEVTVAVEGYAKKSIPNTPTAIATFNASALPMPSLNVSIEAVQSGTGDPSPQNVRPITGWSAVNVVKCGKNLWGGEKLADDIVAKVPNATKDTTNKTVAYSAGYVSSKVLFDNFKPNTIYTIFMMTSSSANNVMVRYTDGTNTYINKDSITVTQANKSIKCIQGIWSTGTTVLNYEECGIFEGAITAEDFVAYNGTTFTTTLKDGNDQPLTCYGGELQNVNGVQTLTLTHGYIASYNGETLPSTWISDRDVYAEGTTPTTGAEVVYELATPQTIPQDSLAIATQDGVNNIWADSGNIQSGEYMEAL